MRDYTAKEQARYERDLERMGAAWNSYAEQNVNGNSVGEPHPATAVTQACYALLLDAGAEEDSPILPELMSFGTTMFKFGQFCAVMGLLENKMQPCVCSTVDDDELNKLLGGK